MKTTDIIIKVLRIAAFALVYLCIGLAIYVCVAVIAFALNQY